VVASLSVSRDWSSIISLYAIRKEAYSEVAAQDFEHAVLPQLRSWIDAELAKPSTAVLGVRQIIAEWDGKKHHLHELTFL
jgi:hypothetical protein